MKNLRLKKAIVLLAATYVVLTCTASTREYHPDFEVTQSDEDLMPFAQYEEGNIYIGNQTYIDSIKEKVESKDILVVDKRTLEDSDMCILDSYRIKDEEARNSILEALLEYERLYPSNWDRTIESMRNEWEVHNILYFMKYKEYRTGHVDLNNDDEHTYDSEVLTKVLRN